MSAVAAPARSRAGRIPGEPGLWLFVLGDMAVFAVCFGVLAWVGRGDPVLYATASSRLHVELGAVNTVVLLTGSLTVALAVRTARAGARDRAARLVLLTIGGALVFVGIKVTEYALLLAEGLTPRTNDVWLYYYGFTGLHLAHVTIGLVVLAGVLRLVRRPAPDAHEVSLVECGAGYWHMVDLLWIVLFALLYLMPVLT